MPWPESLSISPTRRKPGPEEPLSLISLKNEKPDIRVSAQAFIHWNCYNKYRFFWETDMISLFIASLSGSNGKTMLCAGLGKHWLDSGKRVGYLKPRLTPSVTPELENHDAVFIQKLFGLTVSVDSLNPAVNTGSSPDPYFVQTYQAAVQDKDIVVLECDFSFALQYLPTLQGKAILVHDFNTPLAASLHHYRQLGDRLLGVVINKVPRKDISRLQDRAAGELDQAEIPFLGLIPEDRILAALSIADLADAVRGKVLNCADKTSELVENIMLGSSTFDRGAAYYNRKPNKAVLLWGERPGFRKAALSNLQLAALQTSTRCLVISSNGLPIPAVAQKAEEAQVPLISAPGTLPELVDEIEEAMLNLKFTQEKKLPQLSEILHHHLNLQQVEAGLLL
jgi:BioD-like phosphotransacetylase family protein